MVVIRPLGRTAPIGDFHNPQSRPRVPLCHFPTQPQLAGAAAYAPAWRNSQSASSVKPTMMPSIQYCERTASLACP
jgi:hypothetical protein